MNLIKRNIKIMSLVAIFGLIIFVIGIFKDEQLQTMGLVMSIISIIRIVNYVKLLKNSDEAEKYINLQTDERTLFIARKSYSTMYWISVYIEFISSVILTLLNKKEFADILSYIICIQLVSSVLIYWYNNKKY